MTAARRLAAILTVDVVGYSRVMGEDKAGTARAVAIATSTVTIFNDRFTSTPAVPERPLGGQDSAQLRRLLFARQPTALDPLRPVKIGSLNGREARESGLWLKAWVAHGADLPAVTSWPESRP
jgi:hypothetical protein